jgi:hypothetical protein
MLTSVFETRGFWWWEAAKREDYSEKLAVLEVGGQETVSSSQPARGSCLAHTTPAGLLCGREAGRQLHLARSRRSIHKGHGRLPLHASEQCAFDASNKLIHLPPQASQAFLPCAPQTAKRARSISHHGSCGDFISRYQKCQHANILKTAQQHPQQHSS